MNKGLLKILCCPICKENLILTIIKEDVSSIIDGNLHCNKCDNDYKIENYIPHLITNNVRTHYKKDLK